ncbi:MAG: Thioredoxin reductase [candidate division TM6 bacterium GW2011_GWF2_32_72]|nr:MAG: Thioredoxin reductase [candidate division TM6 bacterium GW2011_GWF2_32_72]
MKKIGFLLLGVVAGVLLVGGWYLHEKGVKLELHYNIDNFYNHEKFQVENIFAEKDIVPVLILGSGPAGLSAAMYAARGGFKSVVLAGSKPGGQLMGTTYIENWPGRPRVLATELMQDFKNQAATFGVEYLNDTVTSVDLTSWPYLVKTDEGKKLKALSIVITTGANPSRLGIPGEDKFWAKGVSACATCDAPFFRGKTVAVIGGGDSAAEQALQLSSYAKKVYLLVRRNEMRASDIMQAQVKATNNIEILFNCQPKAVLGEELVTALEVFYKDKNKLETIPLDGVFLAIGHKPNTDLFIGQLDLDKEGYIKVEGRSQKTSKPGVFAAGDVEDNIYRQAGIAAGAGTKAALDAMHFLRNLGVNKSVLEKIEGKLFEVPLDKKVELSRVDTEKELGQVLADNDLVLLDFYGDLCPTCLQMLPVLEFVASKFAEKLKVIKNNVDNDPQLLKKYVIKKVPTFLIFKKGEIAARYSGSMSKKQLVDLVSQFID